MKTKNTSLFLFTLLIMSCTQKVKDERTEEIVADSSGIVVNDEHNAKNSLDYMGYYRGIVPCADCEGIQTELILEEKSFVLKTMYLNVSNHKFSKQEGTYSWSKDGNTIILEGIKNGPSQYFVGENYLIQLDLKGKRISGDLAYKYVLDKAVPPPPPAPDSIKRYSIHSKSLENISLVKNKWRLIELNGKPIESKEMFIKLNNEEGYIAFAGCNNMMGSVEFKDEKSLIKFTKGASTMMACHDMTTEQEFAEMLEKVDNYSLNGNSLSFNRARMATLARFEAMK